MKPYAPTYCLPYIGHFTISSTRQPTARPLIDTPEKAMDFWSSEIQSTSLVHSDKENVVVIALDQRLCALGWHLVSIGTLNQAACHPREIIRSMLIAAAAGFVLMHNHPSGEPSPSEPDNELTRRLISAADVLGLCFADHVIVGSEGRFYSYRGNSFFDENKPAPAASSSRASGPPSEQRLERLERQVAELMSGSRGSFTICKTNKSAKRPKALKIS